MPYPSQPAIRERTRNWVAALRGFAHGPVEPIEHCDLCGEPVAASHAHLIDPQNHRILCACPSCANLAEAGAGTGLRRIPHEVRELEDFRMSEAQWDALMIPIGLAFFFRSSPAGRVVAMYPGPAGAVESLLDLAAWESLVAANPSIARLRPDVEALLVYRIGQARRHFRAPIDRCYALAGLIRKNWHGLSGGAAVTAAIDRFFAGLTVGGEQWQEGVAHA